MGVVGTTFCLPQTGILMAKILTIPRVWKLTRAGAIGSKPTTILQGTATFVSTAPAGSLSWLSLATITAVAGRCSPTSIRGDCSPTYAPSQASAAIVTCGASRDVVAT
jgi:hypothetical protein